MTDLVAFLRERLDERQRDAEGSGLIAWLTYRDPDGRMQYTTVAAATVEVPDHWVSDGREMTGFSSARVVYDEREVLADVEAKRRIVDYRDQAARAVEEAPPGATVVHRAQLIAYDAALRALALPHVSHEDYDEAWRP